MGRPAIEVRGLHKSFGDKQAVAGIDLEIAAGSLAGLVGPNGAGKTTSLSMMTGLLRPDSGRILIEGLDVWADPPAAKAIIGVVPAEVRLFERLSGEELLEYSGGCAACRPARHGTGPRSCWACWTWPRTPGGWSRTTPPGCARRSRSAAP
jgi:ABC-type multidrug transport system ATPase subunit